MNKFIIPFLICILTVSCKSPNDPEVLYADWNTKNKVYFEHMKDSSDYILYQIPLERGGHSFYYKILSQGTQSYENLSDTSWVSINFRGKLITGFVFDQTYQGNSVLNDSSATPQSFRIDVLIKGFGENLKQMKIGEIRRIVLPQELGYGTYLITTTVPPYSVTIWDLQLLLINP